MLARWRQQAAIETFVGDVRLARSSATRSSRPVVMCGIDPASPNRCTADDQWAAGWMVFGDANGNRRFDAGETEIARRAAPSGLGTLAHGTAPAVLAFRANGSLENFSNTVTLQATGGSIAPQYVVLNRTGRVRVSHQKP
jgi:type IV fimbrial biogenesis protein FimT